MANDLPDWMEMQRDLGRVWQSILKQIPNAGRDRPDNDGIGQFLRQFGLDLGGAGDPMAAFTKLFNPSAIASLGPIGSDPFSEWLNRCVEDLLRSSADGSSNTSFNVMDAFLRSPLRLWQSAADKTDPPFNPASWSPMALGAFTQGCDLPPLGLTREWEIRWRTVQRANTDQVDAGTALGRQLGSIYHTALKRFATAIHDHNPADGEISSVRELYDLWISIAEQAYAEQVMTPEYSQAFGHYINASARYRKARQGLSDDICEAMNLPSRRELDSIIERQHALQADLRDLAARSINDIDLDALNRRVEAISLQLDEMAVVRAHKSHAKTRAKPKRPRAKAASGQRVAPGAKRKPSASKHRGKSTVTESRGAGEFDIDGIASRDDQR